MFWRKALPLRRHLQGRCTTHCLIGWCFTEKDMDTKGQHCGQTAGSSFSVLNLSWAWSHGCSQARRHQQRKVCTGHHNHSGWQELSLCSMMKAWSSFSATSALVLLFPFSVSFPSANIPHLIVVFQSLGFLEGEPQEWYQLSKVTISTFPFSLQPLKWQATKKINPKALENNKPSHKETGLYRIKLIEEKEREKYIQSMQKRASAEVERAWRFHKLKVQCNKDQGRHPRSHSENNWDPLEQTLPSVPCLCSATLLFVPWNMRV